MFLIQNFKQNIQNVNITSDQTKVQYIVTKHNITVHCYL